MLVDHLSRYAPADWVSAVETLTPHIHPVDRNATRIWFAFFPDGPLPAHVASSHTFLYGHRFWPQIKRAILAAAAETSWPSVLPDLISRIAEHATRTTQVDRDQLLGISAASLLSLRRAGLDVFRASSSVVQLPSWAHVRSIRQVRGTRAHRRRRPFRSLFGKRRFRVIFSEMAPRQLGRAKDGDSIKTALPVSLQTCGAVCSGACAVGVIAGEANLSPMTSAEASALRAAGRTMAMSASGDPLIRLACHARVRGDVSIVLPSAT